MMINSSAGLLTVCGKHVALWRRPLPRFMSSTWNGTTSRKPASTRSPPILKPGFQPSDISKDGIYIGSTFLHLSPHTLPELDVAPLLNKTIFTKATNSPINGNNAAMRLSKAKNQLREVIFQELEEDATPTAKSILKNGAGDVKKMYIARRHGIPNQFLQHLVTMADQWLQQKNALELWVDSSCPSSLSVLTTDGSSWRTLWPNEWEDDAALYLACMKRMVSHLGSMTPFCDGSSVLPRDLDWNISISRNNKLPLTLFPNDPEVFPVIEWMTPTEQSTAFDVSDGRRAGKIMIRMQGAPRPRVGQEDLALKQSHDVSLIFEATFEVEEEKTK